MLHCAVQLSLALHSAKSILMLSWYTWYLPINAGFFPPKQAAGKVHCAKAASLLWHLDQPNLACTPVQLMAPLQEAPRGHETQSQSFWSIDVSLRYSNALQSEGLAYPSSWQILAPLTLLVNPLGHALQFELGLVF